MAFVLNSATSPGSTVTTGLVSQLRTDIVDGVFVPGSKLVIKDLCQRYGVSLIPMREALSRLTSSGFVTAEDQRGFRVAAASAGDLADITRARILVECEALKLALAQGDVAWEAALLAAHHHLSRLTMHDASAGHLSAQWDGAHMAFHDAMLSACNSPVLLELASNLRQRSARYRHISVNVEAGWHVGAEERRGTRDVAAEHRALVDAALSRDVERATQLLREHFQRTADLAMQRMGQTQVRRTSSKSNRITSRSTRPLGVRT